MKEYKKCNFSIKKYPHPPRLNFSPKIRVISYPPKKLEKTAPNFTLDHFDTQSIPMGHRGREQLECPEYQLKYQHSMITSSSGP